MRKPILCLDFDGVCHSYTSGWKGASEIPDHPVEGLFEFLRDAQKHFEIHVLSSRSHQEGGREAMAAWFSVQFANWRKANENESDETFSLNLQFPTEKPPATVTLDDRGILFTGTWPDVNELLDFKPWYQRADAV